jgi:hypothetical protein
VKASHIILIAALVYTLGRWAHGKPAVTIQSVVSVFFLFIVIGMLDAGETEPVAKGFAWIVLAVALLANDSPVTPIAKLIGSTVSNKPISTTSTGQQKPAPQVTLQ